VYFYKIAKIVESSQFYFLTALAIGLIVPALVGNGSRPGLGGSRQRRGFGVKSPLGNRRRPGRLGSLLGAGANLLEESLSHAGRQLKALFGERFQRKGSETPKRLRAEFSRQVWWMRL